jgi:cytochrome c oxidase cbb3-type subunit III
MRNSLTGPVRRHKRGERGERGDRGDRRVARFSWCSTHGGGFSRRPESGKSKIFHALSALSAVSTLLATIVLPLSAQRRDFPTRPPGDPAAIERGRALYSVNCTFCHGADTRGGDGGPSLLRAATVLDDQNGELIAPVVQNGRADRGMPKFTVTDAQVQDIVAFIHSFTAAGYDASRMKPPSILVGDAPAGEAFFGRTCASCHSASGDLRGYASRFTDEKVLQQTWMMPGSGGRGAAPVKLNVPPTTVTVTLASGEKVEGVLDRLDDFVVSLTERDGTHRSFRTSGDTPKVEVHDPLQAHRQLLPKYSDADIHNVTAYLATLK